MDTNIIIAIQGCPKENAFYGRRRVFLCQSKGKRLTIENTHKWDRFHKNSFYFFFIYNSLFGEFLGRPNSYFIITTLQCSF